MEDQTTASEWTRMVTSAMAELRTSIWDTSDVALATHLAGKYRKLELVPPVDLFSRCRDELSRMRHRPISEMTHQAGSILSTTTILPKPDLDPFRGSPLCGLPRRPLEQAFPPVRSTNFAIPPEQAKTPTIPEEDEEEEEMDEATRAFLANSIAPSLSQLELRTLLKKFNVSPSGLKIELAQRLEQAVKSKAIPMEAVQEAITESQYRALQRKQTPKATGQALSNQFSMVEFRVGPDKLPRMFVETRREVLGNPSTLAPKLPSPAALASNVALPTNVLLPANVPLTAPRPLSMQHFSPPQFSPTSTFPQPQKSTVPEIRERKVPGTTTAHKSKASHSQDSDGPSLKELGVMELRKELKKRGLSPSGLKDELITRLQAAIDLDRQGKPYKDLPAANPRGGKRIKKELNPLALQNARKHTLDALLHISSSHPPRIVVLETGTSGLRAGFAGSETAAAVIPFSPNVSAYQDPFLDKMPAVSEGSLEPLRNGVVINWEAFETAWSKAVQRELGLTSLDGCTVIVTGTGCSRPEERSQICELIFEVFGAAAVLINAPESFSLYSYGATTGFVVESGAAVTSLTPVYETHVLPQKTRFPIAGHHITARLASSLTASPSIGAFNRINAAEEIKQKHCSVSYQGAPPSTKQTRFVLADGTEAWLTDPSIVHTVDSFFNPTIMGAHHPGLHACVASVISRCDPDIQGQLKTNLFLAGGSTMLNGFQHRLAQELSVTAPGTFISLSLHLMAHPIRRYAAWRGAAKFGALSTLPLYTLSRHDYDDLGAACAVRRFF